MKWGILYYKNTDNIGDDIQTYAQMQYLPKIDYYIDRESLSIFMPKKKEYVALIMNAWYLHNYLAWPPSPYIYPLLISMHFTSNPIVHGKADYLDEKSSKYLIENGPVGCRDLATVERLKEHNIPAFFSGCLTLTIKPFENLEKKDYICLVDLNDRIKEKIEKSTKKNVKLITHNSNSDEISKLSFQDRMNNVENLLKTYQQAHLVVTSRLHTALPCLALGTPVILITKDSYEKDRLDTYLKYLCHFKETEFINMNINDLLEKPKKNSKSFKTISNNLEKQCNDFVKSVKNKKFLIKKLPSIRKYNKILEEKKRSLLLYESCWKQSLANSLEMEANWFRLMDAKETIEKLKNNK